MLHAVKARVGEIRPSQLLREFGVGAVVDLPNLSVMVMGLEDWEALYQQPQELNEERLRRAVQLCLGAQVTRLRTPPAAAGSAGFAAPSFTPVGAPVAAFPRWMVCPYCHLLAPVDSGLFQLKTDTHRPDRARYVHMNCAKPGLPPPVLPARYTIACDRGHLDDFPWVYYVHRGQTACPARLTLRESGFSSDVADVYVHCAICGLSRSMADAFGENAVVALPQCRGRRPHVRDFDENGCTERAKTLLLGASNSWFPVMLTVLSVPAAADPLGKLLETYWAQLEKAESAQNVHLMRTLGLLPLLASYTDTQIWDAIEAKRAGAAPTEAEARDLKAPEWRILTRGDDILDHPSFRTRNLSAPPGFERVIDRVVLADRLREVNALVGFTRLASLDDLSETGQEPVALEERLVALSLKAPTWVPAFEVHGEGIFVQFREEALLSWLAHHPALASRNDEFFKAHYYWRQRRHIPHPGSYYPGLRYIFLHSLAHALMRQLALESGYSMASLRERIYSRSPEEPGGPMSGVLIYTSAPDSEGTLGGLVSLGTAERLEHHLHAALESVRWCASDPLCAGHSPRDEADGLHGAACHACLFAPETSCERGNRYLDRSLLLPTIEHDDMAFFSV